MRQTLLYIILLPVYLLSKLIPKNNRLYVFGSCHGLHFADNAKYLYLYASKHVNHIESVFISRNKAVVRQLKAGGYRACYLYSIKGLLTALRAGKCFISHSTHDIHALLVGGADITQLWHGTPLKAIAYDTELKGAGWRTRLKYATRETLFRLFPYLNTTVNFDRLVVASEHVVGSFKSAFRISEDRILPLGQARNDSLEPDYSFDERIFPELESLRDLKKQAAFVISWLPTHRLIARGAVSDLAATFELDGKLLADVLDRHNAVLVVKDHFLDSRRLEERFPYNNRIVVYSHADPYPLLCSTNILITDYSSVFFDFLLLDCPIVFAPFVYDRAAMAVASFYHDYEKVTPGDVCRDWNEVIQALDQLLSVMENSKEDRFTDRRRELCRLFNSYRRGSSKRIIETLFDNP